MRSALKSPTCEVVKTANRYRGSSQGNVPLPRQENKSTLANAAPTSVIDALLFDRAVTRTFHVSPILVSFVSSCIVVLPSEMVVNCGEPLTVSVLVVSNYTRFNSRIVSSDRILVPVTFRALTGTSVSLGTEEIKIPVTLNVATVAVPLRLWWDVHWCWFRSVLEPSPASSCAPLGVRRAPVVEPPTATSS